MRAHLKQRGFTLTEITVALAAGLLVAIAVVGLSKEATTSFHEEVRTAAAEAAARTAIDRIRADLQRAAFMSTGNIRSDPRIARPPGAPYVSAQAVGAFPAIGRLAGVHLFAGGSAAKTPLSAIQTPALNPDAMELGGNFTTTDQYVVRNVDSVLTNGCQNLWLAVDSPAMWRVLSTERGADGGVGGTAGAANANLANTFVPVPGHQFFVRVADDTGHYQYVVTCATNPTGGASGTTPMPFLAIDPNTLVLTTKQTGSIGGASGLGVGSITVNPVQIVRYELVPSTGAMNPLGDSTKYDLVREYVDATGTVLTANAETVAEYAIDLKLAFTVDNGDTTGQNPQLLTLAYDDNTNNQLWAQDVSQMAYPTINGPQRIRSVRVRLVTRSEIADRATLISPNPANPPNELFLYRYCAGAFSPDGGAPSCSGGTPFARARTFTGEVSLPNQARLYYL